MACGQSLAVSDALVPIGDGHTALSDDDRQDLIPTYIATRGELFDAEQRNIATALLRRAPTPMQLLNDAYLRVLHRSMFGDVWTWAGKYRRSDTNIGIEWSQIAVAIRTLTDDARMWVEHATYAPDELSVRFHHRLVSIHPFPNGNGRHGRVAADYLARGLGREPFSWGAGLVVDTDSLRTAYRTALERADGGAISQLLSFARN
ncbi:MAG: mobile mystery protein B [Chloroflexi bacterium]|nr:mobile mystery protein B [Chloroflexota bacterium]MDA1002958.1 mobile mystery protein B [Chloroflexota bacterium]